MFPNIASATANGNAGYYFREPTERKSKKSKKNNSSDSAPMESSKPATINSATTTTTPPVIVEPQSSSNNNNTHNNEINPYAYAISHSFVWRPSFSKSRSAVTSPMTSSANSVVDQHHLATPLKEDDASINPYAYALQNSWAWRRSFSRSNTPIQSCNNSVHSLHA